MTPGRSLRNDAPSRVMAGLTPPFGPRWRCHVVLIPAHCLRPLRGGGCRPARGGAVSGAPATRIAVRTRRRRGLLRPAPFMDAGRRHGCMGASRVLQRVLDRPGRRWHGPGDAAARLAGVGRIAVGARGAAPRDSAVRRVPMGTPRLRPARHLIRQARRCSRTARSDLRPGPARRIGRRRRPGLPGRPPTQVGGLGDRGNGPHRAACPDSTRDGGRFGGRPADRGRGDRPRWHPAIGHGRDGRPPSSARQPRARNDPARHRSLVRVHRAT
ncbi:unannotated protein [freshwater metagenome]|uniref:Unannotated protein n=1 Tax=freshwater metagenome TaxID=449393 RepID=A0A6J7EMF7_9ZZZZ